jgi:hypothetical protein
VLRLVLELDGEVVERVGRFPRLVAVLNFTVADRGDGAAGNAIG